MATAKKKKWLVFVSHAGEDTWVARQIAREISERKATPFLDEADIDVGAEFEENIRDSWIRQTSYSFCLHRGPWSDLMSGLRSEQHGNVESR